MKPGYGGADWRFQWFRQGQAQVVVPVTCTTGTACFDYFYPVYAAGIGSVYQVLGGKVPNPIPLGYQYVPPLTFTDPIGTGKVQWSISRSQRGLHLRRLHLHHRAEPVGAPARDRDGGASDLPDRHGRHRPRHRHLFVRVRDRHGDRRPHRHGARPGPARVPDRHRRVWAADLYRGRVRDRPGRRLRGNATCCPLTSAAPFPWAYNLGVCGNCAACDSNSSGAIGNFHYCCCTSASFTAVLNVRSGGPAINLGGTEGAASDGYSAGYCGSLGIGACTLTS